MASMNEAFAKFLGADWFSTPDLPALAQPNPRRTELAQYLLTHSKPGPTIKPLASSYDREGALSEEPSVINRIFAAMDGPRNYMLANIEDAADNVSEFIEDPSLGNAIDIPLDAAKNLGAGIVDTMRRGSDLPGVVNLSDIIPGGVKDAAEKQLPDRYFSDVMSDRFGVDNKIAKYGVGFIGDVATDPLTYIPGGALFSGAKGAKKASDALTAAAAQSDDAAQEFAKRVSNFVKPTAHSENAPNKMWTATAPQKSTNQIVPPVANMAMRGGSVSGRDMLSGLFPKVSTGIDEGPRITNPDEIGYNILNSPEDLNLMNQAKRSDNSRRAAWTRWGKDPDKEEAFRDNAVSKAVWYETKKQQKLAKQGKVSDGKGNVSQISVARVLEGIERGEIPRWGPEPAPATGIARDIAVREADDHINTMISKGTRSDLNPANQANLYNRLFNATEEIFKSDPKLVKQFSVTTGPKLAPKEKKIAKEIQRELSENPKVEAAALIGKRKDLSKSEAGNLRKYFKETKKEVNLNSPRARQARRVMARAMLKSAEDHMIRLGKIPQYWDGTGVRLSDVLEEIGLEANDELATRVMAAWKTKNLGIVKEPAVAEAIHRALARRPNHLSNLLEDVSRVAREQKQGILDNYSYPKAQAELAKLSNDAAEVAARAGLTPDEIDAVKKLVANVVDVDKMPHEKFLAMLGGRLSEAVTAGRIDKEALMKLNKEITKVIGYNKADLMGKISGNKYLDGMMLRFSTYYGRIPEMKRFAEDAFTWGEMNAVARAEWLRNMVRMAGGNPQITYSAFKVAQGMADTKTFPEPEVAQLANQITDYFETMLGSSGMSNLMQGHTVATRSQIVMEDVNKHLKSLGSNFQFTNKKVKDQFLGIERDFTATGEGWIKSWILANPQGAKQDPVSFMYDMDLAIEKTVKEYALIDEFGRNFGVRKGDEAFDPKVHTARLKSDRLPHDIYFRPEDRDMMQRLLHDVEDGLWRPQSKLIQHYSRGLRAWKTGVTIYMPSHHIRNMIGDLHLMWWAGHNDPRNFMRARRIMHSQRGKYKDALHQDSLDALKGLIDKDALDWAATSGDDIILKQNGVSLNANQLYVAAHQHGLLLDANKYEDIFGQAPLENVNQLPGLGGMSEATAKRIAKPLGGHAHKAASTVAEYREHYIRLSHFVGAVNKGLKKSKDINKVFENAAHEVRKWHPDGRDLTHFEQKTRMAIPFYSWTRKAIPLVAQAAVQRPSKVLYYPRANMALAGMMGVEQPSMLDPFPDDQLFPDWIRAKGIGPVFDANSENSVSAFFGKFGRNAVDLHGNETGYVMANPSNPFMDVIEQIGGLGGSPAEIGRGLFDSSSPAIKIPGEIAMDQTFSGAPISADKPGGQGFTNYLFNQIPIVSGANNVVEMDLLTGKPKELPEGREQGMDTQALINYLTALGLRGTGPYVKTAEFEAADRERASRE